MNNHKGTRNFTQPGTIGGSIRMVSDSTERQGQVTVKDSYSHEALNLSKKNKNKIKKEIKKRGGGASKSTLCFLPSIYQRVFYFDPSKHRKGKKSQ